MSAFSYASSAESSQARWRDTLLIHWSVYRILDSEDSELTTEIGDERWKSGDIRDKKKSASQKSVWYFGRSWDKFRYTKEVDDMDEIDEAIKG